MNATKVGRSRWWMAGLVALAVILGLVVWRVVDSDTYVAPTPEETDVKVDRSGATQVLDDLVTAVHGGDADGLSGRAAMLARNAHKLHVTDFSARYVAESGAATADGEWPADVTLTWRYDGFDDQKVTQDVTVRFRAENDAVRIVRVGGDERTPIWLTGPVRVHRDTDTLTVVQGTPKQADRYAGLARQAVDDVRAVLPWPRPRLVVEVAKTQAGFEDALGAEHGSYGGVAAVTATVDGSGDEKAPVHVQVNPAVIGNLNGRGAQVVISHEATHVATHVATNTSMPVWLLEGFADYVALRNVDLPLSTTAGQVLDNVRDDGPPDHLPGQDEFDTRSDQFGSEYEAAWLACRVLAAEAGEQALVDVYDDVAAGTDIDDAMQDHAGFGVADLTRLWQERLSDWAA